MLGHAAAVIDQPSSISQLASVLESLPESLDSADWRRWRTRLHVALMSEPDLPSRMLTEATSLLGTAAALVSLADRHAAALAEISEYKIARSLSTGADALGFGGSLSDTLSMMMSWQSNSVWVELGEGVHEALAAEQRMNLEDELFGVARITDPPLRLGSEDIAQRIDSALKLLEDRSLPASEQIRMALELYRTCAIARATHLGKALRA